MLIGYARTSTLEQVAGLEAQIRDLDKAGCERIYSEQISGTVRDRPELIAAIEFLRAGDELLVWDVTRLGRSALHNLQIIETVKRKGAILRDLKGVSTASAQGEMLIAILSGVAQNERELMLERQKEGIARAKAEGKYRGRKPTAMARAAEIRSLHAAGVGPSEIATRLGIGRSSVYRALDEIAAGH